MRCARGGQFRRRSMVRKQALKVHLPSRPEHCAIWVLSCKESLGPIGDAGGPPARCLTVYFTAARRNLQRTGRFYTCSSISYLHRHYPFYGFLAFSPTHTYDDDHSLSIAQVPTMAVLVYTPALGLSPRGRSSDGVCDVQCSRSALPQLRPVPEDGIMRNAAAPNRKCRHSIKGPWRLEFCRLVQETSQHCLP